jgi:riboflavin synthase alpha subunit
MPSDEANLEVDLLARYVARLMAARSESEPPDDEALLAQLKNSGFI